MSSCCSGLQHRHLSCASAGSVVVSKQPSQNRLLVVLPHKIRATHPPECKPDRVSALIFFLCVNIIVLLLQTERYKKKKKKKARPSWWSQVGVAAPCFIHRCAAMFLLSARLFSQRHPWRSVLSLHHLLGGITASPRTKGAPPSPPHLVIQASCKVSLLASTHLRLQLLWS